MENGLKAAFPALNLLTAQLHETLFCLFFPRLVWWTDSRKTKREDVILWHELGPDKRERWDPKCSIDPLRECLLDASKYNFFSSFKEVERKIRANDREYNLSFKYTVSIHMYVHVCIPSLCLSFPSSDEGNLKTCVKLNVFYAMML